MNLKSEIWKLKSSLEVTVGVSVVRASFFFFPFQRFESVAENVMWTAEKLISFLFTYQKSMYGPGYCLGNSGGSVACIMDKRNDLDWIGMLTFVYDNEHHLGLQSCVARECDRRGFFHYYYLPPSVLWWERQLWEAVDSCSFGKSMESHAEKINANKTKWDEWVNELLNESGNR